MILTFQINKKIFPPILFLVLSIAYIHPQFVVAQSALSLSVSPTVFQMTANPGQVWESSLRVINNNPFEITVFVEAVNFRPLGEEGASEFIPIDSSNSEETTLAEWISVPSTAIVIAPERTSEIPLVIELPEDVPPGGHYAAILVGTRPPENRENVSKVETAQVVSSLVFLRVSGDVIEQGSIRSFRTVKSLVESPEASFELRFQNTGNVHLRPEGEITIYNMWGQKRGVIPVNQKTLFGNVLSESIRTFNFTWKGEWSPADIGRYKAEAVLAYGDEARNFVSADAHFWVIPWRVLFAIVASLAIIIFLIVWLIKLYVRRVLTLSGVQQETTSNVRTIQKRKEISIVAPIEAGILDLRSRLSNKKTGTARNLIAFIVEYKLFFTGVVIISVIIYIMTWFFGTVSENDRAFEVTISGKGSDVLLDSESLQYEQQQSDKAILKRDFPPIQLVNRSGVNGAAADVALALEELGYTIDSVSTDLNTVVSQTVIIHDSSIANEALELSAVLDNALLSPYDKSTSERQVVIVYVGGDIAN